MSEESQFERESALHLQYLYHFQLWRKNTSSYLSVYLYRDLTGFESEIRLRVQLQVQFLCQFQMQSALL